MERRRVIVHGHVQGVGFRASVAGRARSRGVAGWVRNRADGAVEAVFEGDAAEVASLVRFCAEGPQGATVSHVEERVEGLGEVGRGFEIR